MRMRTESEKERKRKVGDSNFEWENFLALLAISELVELLIKLAKLD